MTAQETMHTAKICQPLKGRHTLHRRRARHGFVREISDIITVMHQGKRAREGTAADQSDPLVREAYLGVGGIARA
jgi:urea transport system ATP-binding protein